jgi:NADPH:quinone reductase-like Zn-dependent oxidoreductase
VKEFGADVVFDYTSPTCAEDIKKFTKNNLKYAVDCITQDSTIKICYSALGRAGGKYTALDPYPQEGATRKVVKPDWVLATRISGRGSHWPEPFQSPPEPAYLEFAKPVYAALQKHLDNGDIRPHKARVSDGGFEDIINGVNLIRQKQVSGEKLVYTISK